MYEVYGVSEPMLNKAKLGNGLSESLKPAHGEKFNFIDCFTFGPLLWAVFFV